MKIFKYAADRDNIFGNKNILQSENEVDAFVQQEILYLMQCINPDNFKDKDARYTLIVEENDGKRQLRLMVIYMPKDVLEELKKNEA